MHICSVCQCELVPNEYVAGVCYKCTQSPEHKRAAEEKIQRDIDILTEKALRVIMTTEGMPVGLAVSNRLGIIHAQASEGVNIFLDVVAEVNDFIGGAVTVMETAYSHCAEKAIARLNMKAANMDADAVIGVSLNYSEMTGKTTKSVIVSATGTAVKLANVRRVAEPTL